MLKPSYPIETARLSLRPFTMDDLEALYAFHSRPDVARFLYWDARTRDETRAALENKIGWAQLREGGDTLNIAAELRETGVLIGDLTLFWRSAEHRQGEIGFVFHPDHHGRGLATEASREILRLGFEDLGLHRIYGRCEARNTPSARLLERLGMRREAHLVENELFKGEWSDELVYAMLRREWNPPEESPGGR
ncbi:N-acetyltransferase [Sphaerisporangium krabiense]|uniref:RimJ/RimL family protein N-acetyltransferase n=1 Tax=Sphaerisporangium krabiense TaxID=763782 RepID=A0A7W9DMS7_9ACTN|nr:GNAT family protein [Sphaerisporangium krabiense]MBB5624667.1 RimJ/RimL family protein N-acetyltransferase [Sphaerisporangium krabiense]GII61376.1 N-acetyltransferase [Sphaerisporangium krabiense]